MDRFDDFFERARDPNPQKRVSDVYMGCLQWSILRDRLLFGEAGTMNWDRIVNAICQ
jgi:hypothetical protein